MAHSLVGLLVLILIVGILLGIAIFMIRKAPFIPGEFKQALEWLAYAVAFIIILVQALPLAGISI